MNYLKQCFYIEMVTNMKNVKLGGVKYLLASTWCHHIGFTLCLKSAGSTHYQFSSPVCVQLYSR